MDSFMLPRRLQLQLWQQLTLPSELLRLSSIISLSDVYTTFMIRKSFQEYSIVYTSLLFFHSEPANFCQKNVLCNLRQVRTVFYKLNVLSCIKQTHSSISCFNQPQMMIFRAARIRALKGSWKYYFSRCLIVIHSCT